MYPTKIEGHPKTIHVKNFGCYRNIPTPLILTLRDGKCTSLLYLTYPLYLLFHLSCYADAIQFLSLLKEIISFKQISPFCPIYVLTGNKSNSTSYNSYIPDGVIGIFH
jgi:hypothetical protein